MTEAEARAAKPLEMLRDGDILVVWKLDRLDLDLIGELRKEGIQFAP